ncbi:MAG: hypothetical protein WAO07_17615 [Desulfobacterales bacterium]
MVEKINTGGKWAWVFSPTGVHKAEQRRSKNRRRDFRRDLQDRYSGKGREESEESPTSAGPVAANDPEPADESAAGARPKARGRRIDVHV